MDKEEQQPQTSFPILLQTTFSASPVLRKIAALYKIAQRKKNTFKLFCNAKTITLIQ
jgi:hypothetical protein